MRPSGRALDQLRTVTLEPGFAKYAEGSCLVRFGDTHVLCTASVDDSVPRFLKGTGLGWVTAEYGMLPRSTHSRTDRAAMPEVQIKVDCDVLQADGGTRTAAITGSYVALHLAFQHLLTIGAIKRMPLTDQVAAVSCGIYQGTAVLDLDYPEDSSAQADSNFVLTGRGGIVEIQGTAEEKPFEQAQFLDLLALAQKGVNELVALQKAALGL
ncbi:MAG TPA: ribonuclease PH [Azospirillum sp.]|nr:ribonuclease PH [Azospirillum sp.]